VTTLERIIFNVAFFVVNANYTGDRCKKSNKRYFQQDMKYEQNLNRQLVGYVHIQPLSLKLPPVLVNCISMCLVVKSRNRHSQWICKGVYSCSTSEQAQHFLTSCVFQTAYIATVLTWTCSAKVADPESHVNVGTQQKQVRSFFSDLTVVVGNLRRYSLFLRMKCNCIWSLFSRTLQYFYSDNFVGSGVLTCCVEAMKLNGKQPFTVELQ